MTEPSRSPATRPMAPVSWGELLDKITILEVKRARIASPRALDNVEREYRLLAEIAAPALAGAQVAALLDDLRQVNTALWEIEEAIRREEAGLRFGAAFVGLARSVYQRNDERAAIKRRINLLLESELVEEKSYGPGAIAAPGPVSHDPGATIPAVR